MQKRLSLKCWLIVAFAAGTAPAQIATTQPGEVLLELRPASILRDATSIKEALDILRAELRRLSPTTQPTTSQPTTQPDADLASRLDGWRIESWQALTELELQLSELLRLTHALEEPASDADVQALTKQIGEWKGLTQQLAELPLPDNITEALIAERTKLYEEHQKRLDEFSNTVAQQEALIKDGFQAQRDRLKSDLARLSALREKLLASYELDLKAADSDSQREIVTARRRAASARIAALEVSRQSIDLKEKTTQKELERNRLRVEALRPLVAAMRERLARLNEEKSRSVADTLRRMLDAPDISPTRKEYIRLQLLCEERLSQLHQTADPEILERCPESLIADQSTSLTRDIQYWEQFAESLSRRSAADVLNAHSQANQEEESSRRELRRFLNLIDQTITEQRAIEDMERRALEAFDLQATTFRSLASGATDAETIKLSQELGQMRIDLRNAHEELLSRQQLVLERLRKAQDLARRRVQLCEQAVSRLYWSHLITRGPHYFDMRRYEALAAEAEAMGAGVLRDAAWQAWGSTQSQSRTMQRGDWVVVVLSLLGNILVAMWLMRRLQALRNPDPSSLPAPVTDAAEPEPLTFVQRLVPQVGRFLQRAVPWLLLGSMVGTLIVTLGLTGLPAQIGFAAVSLWSGLWLANTTLLIALWAPKTRYRVIPCSGVVARHYLRWGRVLITLAVVFFAPGHLLAAAQILPTTSALLNEWFKFFATIAFFCFLIRREAVLSVWPRALRGRFAGTLTTLHAIYPAIALFVLGLVFCRLVGYTALADYLSTGAVSTVLLLLAASVLYQIFRELLIRIAARIRETRDEVAAAAHPSELTASTAQAAGAVEMSPTVPTERLPSSLRLPLTIAKWALAVSALVSALNIWGIRPYEIKQLLDFRLWEHAGQSVTLWRIGGAVAAVIAAIVVSRGARQTLQTRFYPAHPGIDRGAQAAINTLLHYVITFIGVYIGLSTLRLDLGALAVLFGGLGLGIGLGLQPLIVNFISGLLILFERHIKVGDVVMLQDKQGEVVSVNMRSTTLRTPDGLYMIVPNGEFINQKVENWTLRRDPIRGLLTVGVAYSTDPKVVRQTLAEIAEAESRVLFDPPPEVHFLGFGENSLNFQIAAWFRTTGDRWYGMIDMRYAITKRFADAKIEIPFPQRDLHVRNAVLDVRLRHDNATTDAPESQPRPPAT